MAAAGTARRCQVAPFDCEQISGPLPSPFINLPEFNLRKPGQVFLICPATWPMAGYRVRYKDSDGTGGNSAVKVSVVQVIYANETSNDVLRRGYQCEYKSNSDPVGNYNGVATVACPVTAPDSSEDKSHSYQVFVVELWSRQTKPDVRFRGIEILFD